MRLSRLYSNRSDSFAPVDFSAGLNVVLAEIRLPENRNRDTHNLGKTTLGRLLDFAFLSGRDAKFFLFKHSTLFDGFVFFLEIELEDASFITIRRSVDDASKVSFKRHEAGHQDFSDLASASWDHHEVAFDRAKEILDGALDWRALKPWPYRKALGYVLRTQEDFREVFQLRKFASKHSDWKPFLAHILGFDGALVADQYTKEQELEKKEGVAQTIRREVGGSAEDISKIDGILLLKQRDAEKKQGLIDVFDFRSDDKRATKELVDEIDERLSSLNGRKYSLSLNLKKVVASLEDGQVLFSPEDAARLFNEVGVSFAGQLRKDFEQLIAFNRAITDERRGYLQEERTEIEAELKQINAELSILGKQRSEMLSFLSGTDSFGKYKHLSAEMITLRSEIAVLENQRGALHRLQDLRSELRTLAEERNQLHLSIEADVERHNADQDSLFSSIRLFFSEIVEGVIDRKALLSVGLNAQLHLEFRAEILDGSGNATSADLGHTYRKLLCVAFDLAVLRAHLDVRFPRFVYHDGILESLDDRKKENLLSVVREYCDLGVQCVITLIDSDLPQRNDERESVFADEEIVVRLHDEGERGRLFRMRAW